MDKREVGIAGWLVKDLRGTFLLPSSVCRLGDYWADGLAWGGVLGWTDFSRLSEGIGV